MWFGKFQAEIPIYILILWVHAILQVQTIIALFKPANVHQSVPNNRLDERRRYKERRQSYHYEDRQPSLPIEELSFDEQRRPAVHVPVEDPYRTPRFPPSTVESRFGRSLANSQDDHHRYYESAHLPLALDSRHAPLILERHHVRSVPELRHVPAAYCHTLAPSDDSYYRSVADLGPER
jgi:hypothetical protein